jgi:hypothetical protein
MTLKSFKTFGQSDIKTKFRRKIFTLLRVSQETFNGYHHSRFTMSIYGTGSHNQRTFAAFYSRQFQF